MNRTLQDQLVLITGGSSGIGLATAKLLAQEGAHVWLLARRESALQQALAQVEACRVAPSQRFGALKADVADYAQVCQALEELRRAAALPDVVIHAAGIVEPRYLVELPLDAIRRMVEVNFLGAVHVAKAALPEMMQRGAGSLVFLASMAGVINLPGYTVYGASKFALRGFCDALRLEVKRKGVHVAVVFPPDTDTPQHAYELPIRPKETSLISGLDRPLSPERVARDIIRGIQRKQYLIIPGWSNWLFYWLFSALGPLAYPAMDGVLAWAMRKSQSASIHTDSIPKKGKQEL